jgi:hypothetical protein
MGIRIPTAGATAQGSRAIRPGSPQYLRKGGPKKRGVEKGQRP